MPTIIDNQTSPDRTILIFDNFYNTKLNINASEFDIVFSFFKSTSDNDTIAGKLLNQLQGLPNKLEMNKVICYFLNSFKSNTSLYGTGVIPRPNQLAARNVVQ